MKRELSKEDLRLLEFLSKYMIIKTEDCRFIYKSKRYYREKVKRLIQNGYVRKYKYYLMLERKGRKAIKNCKTMYLKNMDNKTYMQRLINIASIATITINSDISFIPSWEMKPKDKYTSVARKYIGNMNIDGNEYLCYYISAKKDYIYIKNIIFDVNKAKDKNIIIFVDNYKCINKKFSYLAFGKCSTLIIKNSNENKEILKNIKKINVHEIVESIYNQDAWLSDWELADYILENERYILYMPFINTEKVQLVNWYYSLNENNQRPIEVLTLEENVDKLNEIINGKCYVRAIDKRLLGGICEV